MTFAVALAEKISRTSEPFLKPPQDFVLNALTVATTVMEVIVFSIVVVLILLALELNPRSLIQDLVEWLRANTTNRK